MTTDNKNDDFIFDSITASVEKSDKDGTDDFDFGDLTWPVGKPDQEDSEDFSFDELSEPVEKPDQGAAELSLAETTVQEVLPFTCLKCAATNEVGFYDARRTGSGIMRRFTRRGRMWGASGHRFVLENWYCTINCPWERRPAKYCRRSAGSSTARRFTETIWRWCGEACSARSGVHGQHPFEGS